MSSLAWQEATMPPYDAPSRSLLTHHPDRLNAIFGVASPLPACICMLITSKNSKLLPQLAECHYPQY
eukprot:6078692-Pyramimonas_sp.AAC.1